jgi:hypothetical protein
MHVHVLYRDLLLALAAMAIERVGLASSLAQICPSSSTVARIL